jgi:hypothetical protein
MDNPDFAVLLTALVPFAEQMLIKHGEFFPFAATITAAGTVVQAGAHMGEEHPKSQDIIDVFIRAFRDQATRAEIRAVGICLDVRTIPPGQTEKTDAISARLEHVNGQAIEVFKPYKRDGSGCLTFGKLFANKGRRPVFGRPPSALV